MAQQVVKKKSSGKSADEDTILIFQLPDEINAIQPDKMSPVIFIEDNLIEVNSNDTKLLNAVRKIEGASDITKTIAKFRGE